MHVTCKCHIYFEREDDGSINMFVNSLTHLKTFCFTGKLCRSCLSAIDENDKRHCFLFNLFFQDCSQCSVTVGSET